MRTRRISYPREPLPTAAPDRLLERARRCSHGLAGAQRRNYAEKIVLALVRECLTKSSGAMKMTMDMFECVTELPESPMEPSITVEFYKCANVGTA